MKPYSTLIARTAYTVSMGAGTSLNRPLFSLGSGFTVTGLDLHLFYGGVAAAAATGFTVGVPQSPSLLEFGIGYGPSGYTPVNLVGNETAAEIWYWEHMSDYTGDFLVEASDPWQFLPGYAWTVKLRSQFRVNGTTDFKFYLGNTDSVTRPFGFLPAATLFYA